MSRPIRVQLSRKKGWRLPANTVVVSRPGKWGNPHRVGYCPTCGVDHTQAEAVAEFEVMCADLPMSSLSALAGKNLACWCKPSQKCHADVLLRFANADKP